MLVPVYRDAAGVLRVLLVVRAEHGRHGGQVALPVLGRMIVPSAYGERYAYGHVVEDGRHMIVSGGLGCSMIPVRFGVPPEIVVVDIGGPTDDSVVSF